MKRMPLVSSALLLVIPLVAACSSSRNLDTSEAQIAFGVKAARMNLWREARFRFERATQNEPNDAMAHNNLAVALEGAGEFDRARVEYLQALQLDQSSPYIQKNYSRFMEYYGKKKKETPKPASETKPEVKAETPSTARPSPVLPPVIEAGSPQKPPEAPVSSAPGPGASGPASTTPPVPVTPNPASPPPATEPGPPPPPPPGAGATGGGR